MSHSIVFMFSGQGANYYHMGKELFEHLPSFRKWMLKIDDMCKGLLRASILSQIYDKNKQKSNLFDQTIYTHPAIFSVEYALSQVLIDKGIIPAYVLGTSLGEFTSAAVAEVMSLEEILQAIIEQARLIDHHCKLGKMIAIIHDVSFYYNSPILINLSELASINYDSHFVIATSHKGLSPIEQYLRDQSVTYQILPVSHAFHSSFIDPAAPFYLEYLSTKDMSAPSVPFVSSVFGRCIDSLRQNYFWEVVRKPILFNKAIKQLFSKSNDVFLDLGPSGTLANFTKHILKDSCEPQIFSIITPFGKELDNIKKIDAAINKKKKKCNKSETEANIMSTYVFPGQGSQKKGMGREVFEKYNELVVRADEILGYSIKKVCIENPENVLNDTKYTQPALYIVNAIMYLNKIDDGGKYPDFLAGHSLGEYNALLAANAFDFETGLRIVQKRGEVMGRVQGGGMAAIIGLDEMRVNEVIKSNNLKHISIANYNSPSQIVISGKREAIEEAESFFKAAGASLFIPLKVSGAFHSPIMADVVDEFAQFLDGFKFNGLTIPVISNVTARLYENEKIKQLLIKQMSHPVQWTESIRYLMGKGEMIFEEIGPGDVLTKLIRKIQREATPLILDYEEGRIRDGDGSDQFKMISKPLTKKIDLITENSEVENKHAYDSGKEIVHITGCSLGNEEFKKTYRVKYAYVAGAMFRGIASKDLVVKMGNSGILSFFGSGGLSINEIEKAIIQIKRELDDRKIFGVNLLHNPIEPNVENDTVDLFLKYDVRNIEAAAYMSITPALVRYRLKGLEIGIDGSVLIKNRIMAKVSRPEIAELFLQPAPKRLIKSLLDEGKVTPEEAECAEKVPMADDLCAEADSAGHTDQGVAYALIPTIIYMRDEMMKKFNYSNMVRVGAAGGIGTPEAAVAAFILGADFILTGSINQCTVEAGTSDSVKDMLEKINVQDTAYAPAGDMFEFGAKVQVLRKGVFFPARANKIYDLYRMYNSLDDIDEKTKTQIQAKYFKRSFEEVYNETKEYFLSRDPQQIKKAERNPKHKMALIFRWYFNYTSQLALSGKEEYKVDYQVHCGPALGVFNQWVKGTHLESWRNRHVNEIAIKIMEGAAQLISKRLQSFKIS